MAFNVNFNIILYITKIAYFDNWPHPKLHRSWWQMQDLIKFSSSAPSSGHLSFDGLSISRGCLSTSPLWEDSFQGSPLEEWLVGCGAGHCGKDSRVHLGPWGSSSEIITSWYLAQSGLGLCGMSVVGLSSLPQWLYGA